MKADDLISMIFILGIIPVTILLIVYFIQKAKIRERMQLLEKGIDISLLHKKDSPFNNILMWGMLSTGIGLGLLLGFLLIERGDFKDEAIMGILAILFGGIGLIIYYFINKRGGNK
jgi:mannitol-specific phosphotransferase system IIBC component